MADVGTFTVEDGVGLIEIDSPPVNALGIAVRRALCAGFEKFAADAAVQAIVILCGGRTFFAGADITEFGKPPVSPWLPEVIAQIDACAKPTVAAIHGTALGGGLEVALGCRARIAVPSARLGLPEVHLGILPGAGGTQRLPRLIGVEPALDMMVSGKPVAAKQALALGLIDALAEEGQLRRDAVALAKRLAADGAPPRIRDRDDKLAVDPAVFDAFAAKNARAFRGFKAPGHIVEAARAATTLPFDEGLKRERDLFVELLQSRESAARRHYFFAERETAKVPDIGADVATLPVKSVGVIGAGTMGGGIAMNFLNIGVPVTLVEMQQDALDRGLGVIRRNYEASAAKGRMTAEQVDQRMALITPVLDMAALGQVDLVIEAVFEQMSVKKEIFAKLDRVAKPGAMLASNTSYLDIDEIAAATQRPESVLGLHFFSPANVMRLVEVIRGARTRLDVIATAMKLGKAIGKVPVHSRVGHGFIANRIMQPYSRGSERLVLEGPAPAEIDAALYAYGFAMGPFQMIDLVGLDVIGRDSTERTVRGDLVKLDRLGQKKNGGFYDYDDKRRATPSPIAAQVIEDLAREKGVARTGSLPADEIVAQLLYPVVNEGAKVLEEGVALRASDIDVAAILGYNWPVYTGGPMFWADGVGLPKIVAKLKDLEARYGAAFRPAALLEKLAAEGGRFAR